MKCKNLLINPPELYDPSHRGYTHVSVIPAGSKIIFVSGQVGEDSNGKLISNDFDVQLQQVFKNLKIALEAVDAHQQQVVKITVLMIEPNESKLQKLAASVKRIWGNKPPASTLIPVPRLALNGTLLEIEATAAVLETKES